MNIEKTRKNKHKTFKTQSKMKKSVFKSGLVAAIAVVMMSCTTTANAQTGNTKYIYGQDGTNTTVYTLNEDGKTLTRKLKYEYKHDENGQVIEKKAYRLGMLIGNCGNRPYLLTVTPGVYETKLNYAEWNVKESAFNNNKQQSIYREDNNINLLADTQKQEIMEAQTQKNSITNRWQTIRVCIGNDYRICISINRSSSGYAHGNSFWETHSG
ncbi:DUF3836 domain-containing protein [Phocaeicola dorei]|nr:DUF3836 domain-containing protein [Phocaeicola dorei]